MASGEKDCAGSNGPLDGLEEATAGWDPYVSELINATDGARQEERRRRPRDRTPARRRAILATEESGNPGKTPD
jgi:hypothetical protein